MGLEAVKLSKLCVFGKDRFLKRARMLDLFNANFRGGESGSGDGDADAYPESAVRSELALKRLV